MNEKVLKTLEYLNSIGKNTVIRTVIVPGINDSTEILDKYLELIKDYSCISKYELLAFHTMGFFKYENLGIENKLKNTNPLGKEVLENLQSYINNKIGLI